MGSRRIVTGDILNGKIHKEFQKHGESRSDNGCKGNQVRVFIKS